MDRCLHRYGLSPAVAMERAARWAGLPFAGELPSGGRTCMAIRKLDSLGEVRAIRIGGKGRDVLYCSPGLQGIIDLARHTRRHPHLRESVCLVPIDVLRAELGQACAGRLTDEARQRLARRWPFASAHHHLPLAARLAFVAAMLAATLLAALAPFLWTPLFMPLVGIVLIAPSLVRLAATLHRRREEAWPRPLLADGELPVYSILVPLRDEAHMVPMLRRALGALDYPPEKLDIKFVVESRSAATIAAVRAVLDMPCFELVAVPDVLPHTKPKALNFALPLVRGEYVVIYDAEDIPAPDQLRRAATELAADPSLDCLQAELTIDNAGENLLTALFAGEYAGQFGLLLPFLADHHLPMPLGGTSNHFRVRSLRELGGWDAFNVTEDADLGTRLARLRYRSATLQSHTREEAPVSLDGWIRQRTRWMKGWMQTFIVHNRSPRRFLRDIGWRGFLAFEIHIFSMILSALLHSVFLVSYMAAVLFGFRTGALTDGWDVLSLAILILGYGGAGAIVVAGLLRQGQARLIPHQLALPLYWMLHSVAAMRALGELLTRPYFWAKTEHGRTRMKRSVSQWPAEPQSAAAGEAGIGGAGPLA